MLSSVEHASVAQQFEPAAVRVVHHEKGDPISSAEIAGADQLAIALEIREANEIRPQKPLRTQVDRRGVGRMASLSRSRSPCRLAGFLRRVGYLYVRNGFDFLPLYSPDLTRLSVSGN